MREQILARFADRGIESDRLILKGHSDGRAAYLDDYSQVDIGLNPFPYPGVTTSIESLWMGVPVITRAGDRFLSRMGESVAHNTGMQDWIAADADAYVAMAVARAADLPGLSALRAQMRDRMRSSPMFDAPAFAQDLEQALWAMHRAGSKT